MSCSWCPKVDSRWFVQQHCLGGEGTEKSSWPLYSRGGVVGQDFGKIWLFPFCPNLAQIWKREIENFKVYWSSEAQLRRGIKGRGGISLKQNPKLWGKKNIRSLFLGLFNQGNSHQKTFLGNNLPSSILNNQSLKSLLVQKLNSLYFLRGFLVLKDTRKPFCQCGEKKMWRHGDNLLHTLSRVLSPQ